MSDDKLAGILAYENHEECPESATEGFRTGYGLAYAAAEAKPPIDLRSVDSLFNEVFENETE